MTEVLNKAIDKSKGDPGLKQLAANMSLHFRNELQSIQGYAPIPTPRALEAQDRHQHLLRKGAESKTAASSDKTTNARLTTKAAAKAREQHPAKDEKARVFIRGPSKPETDETVAAVARVMGAAPEELHFKKVNSSWSFMAPKKITTTENMQKVDQAHARIKGLSDFYGVGKDGLEPTKNEQWLNSQIAKQTGGEVKFVRWQFETVKYKDAKLRIAVDLPRGKKLPASMTFEGSDNKCQVVRCRVPSIYHYTVHAAHEEKNHVGPARPCLTCGTEGHAPGDAACAGGARARNPKPSETAVYTSDFKGDEEARSKKRP
ncbi:hypothetical protein Cpir12675_005331 [Ceratocystis pirilliformis]|uniref:Uncharacterized protein n=1 Tax=Ceratocystis pirilliformis TaxID=259994 RepID=A0ABR3YRT3_9PEZI